MRKFASISISLKMMQGALAFITIALQSHALTNQEFNSLSVIGNAIIMTSFLDLGIGVQFIQNHLNGLKNTNENEGAALLHMLKLQSKVFIKIALIQSAIVTIYSIIYGLNLKLEGITLLALVTLVTTFAFSIGGIISKALTARGYVIASLWYQFSGVFFQLSFLSLAYKLNLSFLFYIGSLAIPNLVLMVLTLRKLSREKNPKNRTITFVKSRFVVTNLKVQVLQIIQFLASTLPLLLLSMRIAEVAFSIVLIYWRIFTSVAATTSSFNSQEWRDMALKNGKENVNYSDITYLLKKVFISFLLASIATFGTNFFWEFISDVPQNNSNSFNYLWIIFVVAQIYQWHFYFKLLALQYYSILIQGSLLSFCMTLLVFYSISAPDILIFPSSIVIGMLVSGIYFQFQARSYQILLRIKNA